MVHACAGLEHEIAGVLFMTFSKTVVYDCIERFGHGVLCVLLHYLMQQLAHVVFDTVFSSHAMQVSELLLRKYTSLLDIALSYLLRQQHQIVLVNKNVSRGVRAMQAHQSQWVW